MTTRTAPSRAPRHARRPLRRRDAAHTRDTSFGPSMTPMVDVVLVILIFFMASTAFVGPEWLLRSTLPAPGAGASEAAAFRLPPARFDLALARTPDGATAVTGMGLDAAPLSAAADRIRAYAARLGPDRLAVILAPAPDVPYADVVRLHEVCAQAGIQAVGLAR